MKKQNNGITLISLVITIIILLILAGISISALTRSGLFENAKLARNRTQEAQELENQMLLEYESQINQLGGILDNEEVKKEPANNKTAIENAEITKPSDAIIIESDETKGIVMKDSKDNEWVWIEVPGVEVFKTATSSTQYNKIKTDLINYVTSPTNYRDVNYEDLYYEGCGVVAKDGKTAQQVYEEMYEKMLSSIYTNGGFWISRYELGIKGSNTDTTLGRTTHTDITESSPEAVIQIDHIPYNYITCSEAQTLASKMTTDSTKTSSLLFGIQWDLVCKHLEVKGDWDIANPASYYIKKDSTSWGNYYDATLKITSNNAKQYNETTQTWTEIAGIKPSGIDILLTTGASEETNKMNIYDLAGNANEWTLEQNTSNSSSPCASRGGFFYDCGSTLPASNRSYYPTSYGNMDFVTRSTLY